MNVERTIVVFASLHPTFEVFCVHLVQDHVWGGAQGMNFRWIQHIGWSNCDFFLSVISFICVLLIIIAIAFAPYYLALEKLAMGKTKYQPNIFTLFALPFAPCLIVPEMLSHNQHLRMSDLMLPSISLGNRKIGQWLNAAGLNNHNIKNLLTGVNSENDSCSPSGQNNNYYF
ncbi:hypothetical protein ACJX0J_038519 [Zea mays]